MNNSHDIATLQTHMVLSHNITQSSITQYHTV